ncbi:hypothetical protein [Clostridium paraputrificum]|nr:hypothetical protein [Clostridium paraputrificum]
MNNINIKDFITSVLELINEFLISTVSSSLYTYINAHSFILKNEHFT